MSLRSNTETWGSVTRTLHWLGALLILGLLADGWWMTHLAPREVRLWNYGTHGLIAMYVGLLLVLRIAWRLSEPTPRQPAASANWQVWTAQVGHLGLYLLLIAMLMTGYLMWNSLPNRFDPSRAALFDYTLFGVFKVPGLSTVADRAASKSWEGWHEFTSHLLQALVVVHIAAAVWHRVYKRDNILGRMISGRT